MTDNTTITKGHLTLLQGGGKIRNPTILYGTKDITPNVIDVFRQLIRKALITRVK